MARSGPCSHLGVFPPLCAALFLTACVPNLDFMNDPAYRSVAVAHRVMVEPWSRSPLFAEDTVESELRLDGDWSETSSTATWTFAASEGNDYRLTVNEDGYAAIFKATIVFLGQHRFLDLRYELPPGLQTSPPRCRGSLPTRFSVRGDR